MAFTVYSDELSRLGYLRESAFGTAMAANSAFKELIVPKGTRIDLGIKNIDLERNRASRILNSTDNMVDNYTGPVVCSISDMIVTRDRFCDMLFACLQNRVSEGATPNYSKVITQNTSQPDFTANAGYFFTLAWKQPVTGKDILVTSCIVRKMTVDFDKTKKDADVLVHLRNVEIIGKKAALNQTLTGTWVIPNKTYVSNSHGYVLADISANTLPWIRASLSLDNGAKELDRDTDGTPRAWFLDPPKQSAAIFNVTQWYNNDTYAIDSMATQSAGTPVFFNMLNTDANFAVSLSVVGVIDGNSQGTENRQMIQPMKIICCDTFPNPGVSFTITDHISQG